MTQRTDSIAPRTRGTAIINYEPTVEFGRRLDAADPLRSFRERFALPRGGGGEPLVYLCGHSLGLMPLAARGIVMEELDDWAKLAVLGHEHAHRPWIPYHENLRGGLATLAGARPAEVVAMSSLTVNLHLLLAAFYRPSGERRRILIEAGAFSSDRHAVASQIVWRGLGVRDALIELPPPANADTIPEEQIEEYLAEHGAEVALVLWPGVQYRTGQAFDLGRITRAAHRAGCVVGIDLAHAIGNMPLAMHDIDADFAVWCSYKYLNAGPGAIGGCFVHERHERPHLAGWWGHEPATRFQMRPEFHAAPGVAGWQISNPPILSAAPLIASLAIFDEAGMQRLRQKSVALTGYLEYLLDRLAPDLDLITPRAVDSRGCQLSIRVKGPQGRGRRVFDALTAQGVIGDWREPDTIRLAPIPLYNTFADTFRGAQALAQALRLEP
ncbi:MAG TPA: kynureninase [Steroidobacteraceae bacterium]|nr:kynureninase [Steroidobacteraceae bacterium]